jgi:hypothetical protein
MRWSWAVDNSLSLVINEALVLNVEAFFVFTLEDRLTYEIYLTSLEF